MNSKNINQSKYHSILIFMAFIVVIFIWSTTPVAIKWSSEGVSFLFGVFVRMSIGAVVALILVWLRYRSLPMDSHARKIYFASAVGIFGGMVPVYWAAQHISSGLISVIFGLSPMVTGYIAWRFGLEPRFNRIKIIGSVVGLSGLLAIFYKGFSSDGMYVYGIIAMVTSVILHSISAIWIKRLNIHMPPLTLVAGGLLFSMPMFITVYLIFAPPLVAQIPIKTFWSILYLGVVGSVIGFMSYYFLLKHLAASSVVLITLVTPVSALWIGYVVNDEGVNLSIYIGTVFVLIGLLLHQSEDILSKKTWGKRKHYSG